jgi:hypothetical protein
MKTHGCSASLSTWDKGNEERTVGRSGPREGNGLTLNECRLRVSSIHVKPLGFQKSCSSTGSFTYGRVDGQSIGDSGESSSDG